MEGLDALMYSAKTDSINFLAKMMINAIAIDAAQTRLEWVEHQKTHPNRFSQPLAAPLIVAGAPRSGTTLMHRLLAADSANQAIPMWRLLKPFPPQKG